MVLLGGLNTLIGRGSIDRRWEDIFLDPFPPSGNSKPTQWAHPSIASIQGLLLQADTPTSRRMRVFFNVIHRLMASQDCREFSISAFPSALSSIFCRKDWKAMYTPYPPSPQAIFVNEGLVENFIECGSSLATAWSHSAVAHSFSRKYLKFITQ